MSVFALPQFFRFAIFNQVGSSISTAPVGMPTVDGVLMHYDANGSAVYDSNVTFFCTAQASIGNNSYVTGSTFSNTSGWLTGDFLISVFASGNASGSVSVFFETSLNGISWPNAASANGLGGGFVVAAAGFGSTTTASTASTTRQINFNV